LPPVRSEDTFGLTFELTHPAAQIRGKMMPEPETIARAGRDKAEGKSPSTQAGEFVREEMQHVREGKHEARSPQQAIAIGLSKEGPAGVKLGAPKAGRSTARARKQAARGVVRGRSGKRRVSPRRSRATEGVLKRESGSSASQSALSWQARGAARRRGRSSLHNAAMRAVHTKGKEGLRRAGQEAVRIRQRHSR
jgi:hypothetical protein